MMGWAASLGAPYAKSHDVERDEGAYVFTSMDINRKGNEQPTTVSKQTVIGIAAHYELAIGAVRPDPCGVESLLLLWIATEHCWPVGWRAVLEETREARFKGCTDLRIGLS